jgi:DNA-3-methyladenine glycosylase II
MLPKARAHLQSDPVFAHLIRNYELTEIAPRADLLPSLVQAIISQQLSTKASDTIFKRLLALLPTTWTARDLTKLTIAKLRTIGISSHKATYLHAAAQYFISHQDDLARIHTFCDDQIINQLTQIKGVGRWTAEMMLIFTFARPDVFSLRDLGLRAAIEKLYQIPRTDLKQIEQLSLRWKPYRSYASRYLWLSLENKTS